MMKIASADRVVNSALTKASAGFKLFSSAMISSPEPEAVKKYDDQN